MAKSSQSFKVQKKRIWVPKNDILDKRVEAPRVCDICHKEKNHLVFCPEYVIKVGKTNEHPWHCDACHKPHEIANHMQLIGKVVA